MDERVSKEAPNLAVPHRRAIKHQTLKKTRGAEAHQERRQDREHNMRADENRRHIDGITSHPADRSIIIGGSNSEHETINDRAFMRASGGPVSAY